MFQDDRAHKTHGRSYHKPSASPAILSMPAVAYAPKRGPNGIALLSVILKSLKGSANGSTPASPSGEVSSSSWGKETQFLRLHKRLGDKSLDYSERAQTAVEMQQVLKELEADCIPAVWYSAHDLTEFNVPEGARKCAFELLAECISECKDSEIKKVYFHIVMDILVESSDNDRQILDPHIALILSCLRLLLDGSVTLGEEDVVILNSTIEDIINRLARAENRPEANTIRGLLQVVLALKHPIPDDGLVRLLDLLCSACALELDLTPVALDYILYLTLRHEELLNSHALRQFIPILSRISNKLDDSRSIERLNYVLHQIAQSRSSSVFLNELFKSLRDKNPYSYNAIDFYPFILVDDLCRYGENNKDLDAKKLITGILETLFQLRKDKVTIKVIALLLRRYDRLEQSGIANDILGDERFWPLLKSILSRSPDHEDNSKFIGEILDVAAKTKLLLFATSVDDLVQFICALRLPPLCCNLIELIKARRADVNDIKTVDNIGNCALSSNASTTIRMEYFSLLIDLVKDAAFEPLRNAENQFTIALNTLTGTKDLNMSDNELLKLEDLFYVWLRHLQLNEFRKLINEHIISDIQVVLAQKRRRKSIVEALGGFGRPKQLNEYNLRRVDALVKSCVKTFIWSATELTGQKCILLFNSLCSMYSIAERYAHSNASLAVARAMVRIRKSPGGHFYFTIPIDAVGISSAFGRLKEQVTSSETVGKWTFPESVEYIEISMLGKENENVGFTDFGKEQGTKVNIGRWLSSAIDSIKAPTDWEIYSYLLAHLCSQLSEISLLQGHFNLIEDFKDVICDHLTRVVPSTIELNEDVSHSDLHSAYVRSLSSVLAYHPYQQKKFADELISALVVGLKSWEKTLIPILHILSVSCFEVPLSIQRCLTHLLPQIQMRITNQYAMPSVLEFLLALRNSPRVISNLTIEELKRVFGIVFKLIENSVDLKLRSRLESEKDEPNEYKHLQPHNQEYDVEVSPSTENFSIKESMVLFLQYQSFEVLSSWFCSLNADKIKELQPFIMAKLKNLETVKDLKYDALAHIDFVQRSQFISQSSWGTAGEEDENAKRTRWVGDSTLISIGTSRDSALIKIWKPTCSLSYRYEPRLRPNQATYDVFGFSNNTATRSEPADEALSPVAVLSQLSYFLEIPGTSQQNLLMIPDDMNFNRSVNMLDRLPSKEFQKTGIIYIGKKQNTEAQVLGNTEGSHQYHWFLDQMGQFIKLSEKPKLLYTGGLEDAIDGEFALIWSDQISHIAFHTTTLMPNTADLSSKKRHVGNNFVNIFYNESELPHFNFNIIRSQFTFISIVITPQTAPSHNTVSEHYQIKLYRRTGTPALLSCAHFKILTKNNLARYVRHVSQIANALAEKTHERHPPGACSVWGTRYKHLDMIRERVSRLNEH